MITLAPADLENIARQARTTLAETASVAELEAWRIQWLGAKGRLAELFDKMKAAPPAEKRELGRQLNHFKTDWTAALEARRAELDSTPQPVTGDDSSEPNGRAPSAYGPLTLRDPACDWTLPPIRAGTGRPHLLARVRDEIADIFERMGFTAVASREVEDDFHNFVALNIPADHPARDRHDNFVLDGHRLLRTQTSTAQVRMMRSVAPPLRIIHCGRVYRPDVEDRTHADMFHQIEALAVDRGLTMAHLKRCILLFARTYFGPGVNTRFRPSFFPFTEPSAEVDITCPTCGGSGRLRPDGTPLTDATDTPHQAGQTIPCPMCKASGWIEMGGCGMVDPNVFAAVGYDPEAVTGFAFGLGIERIAMRKYGVPDIRLFCGREFTSEAVGGRGFGNDLRFLSQFS